MKSIPILISLSLTASAWAGAQSEASRESTGLKIPVSSQHEHKELHEAIERAARSGGKTAATAKKLAAVMDVHFAKEERYALPLLTLLAPLSRNEAIPQSQEAIKLAEALRKELPGMLAEHKQVASLLIDLKAAALQEGKIEVVTFADSLSHHAGQEEEILYPAALLVGEHLKTRSQAHQSQ